MISVGWLADKHNPPGGAEFTQQEFRDAAPSDISVRDVETRGPLPADIDKFVVHNCLTYERIPDWAPVIRYVHDLTGIHCKPDKVIFCSPQQRDKYEMDGELIPPPIDLAKFRPPRQVKRNGKRNGICCVGAFMNPGKGGHLVEDWATTNDKIVDFYGWGPFSPQGPHIQDRGPIDKHLVPQLLWQYETFIFLPTCLEPFGRCVAEAWAAGCQVITNDLVGAKWWIENEPDALETAAGDFWKSVLA